MCFKEVFEGEKGGCLKDVLRKSIPQPETHNAKRPGVVTRLLKLTDYGTAPPKIFFTSRHCSDTLSAVSGECRNVGAVECACKICP